LRIQYFQKLDVVAAGINNQKVQEPTRDPENLPHTDKATEQQITNEFQNVLRILVDAEL